MRPLHALPMLLATSLAGLGCLTEATPPDLTDDEIGDDEAPGQLLTRDEGGFGRVWVRTPDGPMLLSYQVVDGHAIHELDMDLGPIDRLLGRGGAANLGERWPDGIIPFAFQDDFDGVVCKKLDDSAPLADVLATCVDVRTRVRDTLAAMEDRLPFDFQEVSYEEAFQCDLVSLGGCGVVVFRHVDGQDSAGKSSHTGKQGGIQYVSFRSGHAADAQPSAIAYHLEPSAGTVRHEVLHAAGLWHEQSRTDRNEFVTVNYGCIKEGTGNGNYDLKSESADLGPYDYQSIMHYRDTTQCNPPLAPAADLDGDGCMCKTLTPTVAGAEIKAAGPFSIEDTNTVYRMYTRPLGYNTPGDKNGAAVAIADFDADGYDDLAVGVPGKDLPEGSYPNITAIDNAGTVYLWRGTSAGPVAWMQLTVRDLGEKPTAGARLGTALVAYDADADGVRDLAVGAPGAHGDAGAVYVWRGQRKANPAPHRILTQKITAVDDDVAGDHFGAALAAGPFTGLARLSDDCDDDNKVPHPIDALAVGAPGDAVTTRAGAARVGSVFVFQETRPACSDTSVLNAATVLTVSGRDGDEFGAALAAGPIDTDGLADLAVGAPNTATSNGSGRVYLYKGRLPTENPLVWSAMLTYQSYATSSFTTQFGRAIAIGKILSFGGNALVVGAPGGQGKVTVFSASFAPVTQVSISHPSPATGDEFGAALAIGAVDNTASGADLVIGAPGDDGGAGIVLVVRGGASGLPTRTLVMQGLLPYSDRAAGDRFGAALAIGNLDGESGRTSTADTGILLPELVVGAPGETPDKTSSEDADPAGAVDVWQGQLSARVAPWLQRHQRNSGRLNNP